MQAAISCYYINQYDLISKNVLKSIYHTPILSEFSISLNLTEAIEIQSKGDSSFEGPMLFQQKFYILFFLFFLRKPYLSLKRSFKRKSFTKISFNKILLISKFNSSTIDASLLFPLLLDTKLSSQQLQPTYQVSKLLGVHRLKYLVSSKFFNGYNFFINLILVEDFSSVNFTISLIYKNSSSLEDSIIATEYFFD